MHYRTICLQLIEQTPQLHEQLRKDRKLFSTMKFLASQMRTRHLFWIEQLSQARPGSNPSQINFEAFEHALEETRTSLALMSPPDEEEVFSLDAAMAHSRHHPTPPA